jgi:kynurenine formamidase
LENNDIEQGEHAGTHMDAPAHFIKGKWRIHQIPMEKFAGPAVVVDITEKAKYVCSQFVDTPLHEQHM